MVFIAETVMAAGLCYIPLKRVRDMRYVVCTSEHAELVQTASGKTMEGQMISDIEEMAGVCRVSVNRAGDTFDVFVVMENMDFEPFDAVIRKKVDLYDRYPDLTFNFDVMPLNAV
jgi:hypothetical protein